MAKITFRVPEPIQSLLARKSRAFSAAVGQTVEKVGRDIETAGRANIASAGFRSPKWSRSLNVSTKVTSEGGTINVRETMWQWAVFEKGARIRGTPLWVPLTGADTRGLTAKQYGRTVSRLFRVERAGKPDLLLSGATKRPLYVAVEQVTLNKRLDLRNTITKTANEIPDVFKQAIRFV